MTNHNRGNLFRLIDRYILGKYLKTFLLAMALIIVIVITFDISEKLDRFQRNSVPLKEILFSYYLNFIPGFVNMYGPLFIFISVIFFTSKMASNTEIIAILSSGISYRRMLLPYLYGSIIIALLSVALSNFVIPWSNRYLDEFENHYLKSTRRSYYANIHLQAAPNCYVYAESYDVNQRVAFHFQQDTYDPETDRLQERILAEDIHFDTINKQWEAHGYTHRTFDGMHEQLQEQPYAILHLSVTPDDFDQSSTQITTINTFKLIRHIQRQSMQGSSLVAASKIELYQRLLNPLSILVMTFIGVAISSRKTRGGIGVHLAIGITIAFAYIVLMRVSTVFATNGNLSPFLAILLPQVLFALAALYLIHTAPK